MSHQASTIETDGWCLVSAEEHAAKHPRFEIPDRSKREALVPGDAVQVMFDIETHEGGVAIDRGVDRMWVLVKKVTGTGYIGVLDSDPGYAENLTLRPGTEITFGVEHIIAIDHPPRSYVEGKYGAEFFSSKSLGANKVQRQGFRWIVGLVGVDLVTKLVALSVLNQDVAIDHDALFQFVLRVNATGVGTLARMGGPKLTLVDRAATGLIWFLIACSIIAGRRFGLSGLRLFASAFFTGIVGKLIVSYTAPWLELLPTLLLVVLLKLGPTLLFILIWWAARKSFWRVATILLCASALGNFLCLAFPPYGVVDFMHSRLASQFLFLGVFNLADLYFNLSVIFGVFALLEGIVRRFIPKAASTPGASPQPAKGVIAP